MDFKDRQREAMRLAARIESKAAEANSEAKSAGGKEWEANSEAKSAGGKEREPEFLFFYRCHTALVSVNFTLKMESTSSMSLFVAMYCFDIEVGKTVHPVAVHA